MRTLTAVVVAIVLLVAGAVTQERRPQDMALQAAIRTETVDGDLEKAIKQFGEIADKYKSDRTTAATALVHMAGCYQKRGDAQAKAIYERIVREFADQRDAVAVARAKLGDPGDRRAVAMTYQRVWSNPENNQDSTSGTVSPDGRYLSYVDWTGGDLMLRDLAAGTARRLTGNGNWPQSNEYAEQSAISRDGNRVAYSWFNGKDRYQLRVGDLNAAALQPRTVLDQADVIWLDPHDWSPDGRSVVVVLTRKDRKTEIALVGVNDGSVRKLKSTDWSGPSRASLSPDGRVLAFDRAVGKPADEERDVFVMAMPDGKETAVTTNPGLERLVGWSPDGTRLLFSSDRGGSLGLWVQPMSDGTPRGVSPELLKSEIGAASLGVTAQGGLYVGHQVAGPNIYIAEVDFKTGAVLKPATQAVDRFVGMNEWPDWSRDGKFLSYVYARNWIGRSPTIAIRSLDNGRIREIPLDVINGRSPLWAPDGHSFVTHGVDADGRTGIYRIDARDGAVTPIVHSSPNEFLGQPEFSPDGRKVYFGRWAEQDRSIVEYDLESGRRRDVIQRDGIGQPSVSPDGRSVATIQRTADASVALVASLVEGGEPRELLRVSRPQVLTGNASWTPDSRGLMMNTFWNNGERRETWLVYLDGGIPKAIDLPGYSWGRIRVHPDGKRVAYHAGQLKSEVWVLENFLPAQTSAKR